MKNARLLIADAHQDMLAAVRGLLEDRFEVVAMVADGDSLIEVANAVDPNLIVVDLSLPVTGTGCILRQLRLQGILPRANVVALSIHDEEEAVREALDAGATGFVLKRAAVTDLIPAVDKALLDRQFLSPALRYTSTAEAERTT